MGSSLKLVKIWLLWRRITRKSVWTLWKARAKKEKNTKNIQPQQFDKKKKIEKLYHDFHLPFFVTLEIIPVHFFHDFIIAHPSKLCCPAPPFLLSFVVTYSKLN